MKYPKSRARHHLVGREDLIMQSGVREVFTPHRPVQTAELFFGRHKEVQKLIEHINTPGQHCLLYGDRGVGKSSLANIAMHLLSSMMKGKLYIKRCDSRDTFGTIMAAPLLDQGLDTRVERTQETTRGGGSARVKIPVIEAGVGSQREVETSSWGAGKYANSPSWVCERIQDHCALLVIDEADSISEPEDRLRLAELMKHLSDANSKFKILMVGIASTGAELVASHASVERCLRETYLGRMTNIEVRELIEGGAKRIRKTGYQSNFSFDPEVLRSIVELSSGYPHFAHLLALKSAEEAIAHERNRVIGFDLESALQSAAEDAETSLRRVYHEAVRSSHTMVYRYITGAAAACGGYEFTANDLCKKVEFMYGESVSSKSMQNHLRKLASSKKKSLFKRVAKGLYSFRDPRMSSYVKMVERWTFIKTGEL